MQTLLEEQSSAAADEEPSGVDEKQTKGQKDLNWGAAKEDKRRDQQRSCRLAREVEEGLELTTVETRELAIESEVVVVTDLEIYDPEGGELVPT